MAYIEHDFPIQGLNKTAQKKGTPRSPSIIRCTMVGHMGFGGDARDMGKKQKRSGKPFRGGP